jgi:hypothetical protein
VFWFSETAKEPLIFGGFFNCYLYGMATISTNDIKIRYDIDLSKLQQATSEFDKITSEERQLLAELGKLKKQFDELGDKAKKSGKDAGDAMGGMGAVASKIAPAIAGIFAADKVMGFAKEVIAVTGEFQKLSAVLTNTLGSRSAAAGAMTNIQKFASETPFSVQELTQSFVKLANQGFTPTVAQLRRLGDLASSTGKGFDQLAEAIIDAQTGEFERLKEFGIRASKAGDQVTFTFKGVQTQVQFTNDAIRQYLVSLGDIQGVSGAMAAISGTLEGQISNLGDAYDSLLNTIGTNLAPVYQKALVLTSAFLNKLNDLFGGKQIKEAGENFNKLYEKYSNASSEALKNGKTNAESSIKIEKDRLAQMKQIFGEETKAAEVVMEEYRASGSEYDDIQKQSITTSRTVTAEQIANQESLINSYQLNIDVFNKLYEEKKKNLQVDQATEKQDKAAYQAKLKIYELEKQQQVLMAQLRGSKLGEVGAEKVFQQKVYDLKKEYSTKNIGIIEDEVKVAKLQRDKAANDYEDAAKKELLVTKEVKIQVAEEDKTLYDKRLAQMKAWQKAYEKGLADEVEAAKKAEEEKQAIKQLTLELGQTLVSGAFDLYQANLSNELSALQKRYNEEIRLADGNEQKITEINNRRDQKEREIKTRQFQAERNAAVARVVFETASIIAKWSSNPITLPLAALTLATQAAQIGFILAQPVPEFAEGTKGKAFKGGKAIVGERGVEKVVTESGKVYFTPPTATLVDLPKGSQVIPNHSLSRQEVFLANHYANRTSSSAGSPVVGKLDEIGSILKGLPITQLNMDERGFEKFIRTPRRSTKILNNRFGINN